MLSFFKSALSLSMPQLKKRDALNTTLNFYYSSYHMEVKVLVNGYHDITVWHAQSMIGEKG